MTKNKHRDKGASPKNGANLNIQSKTNEGNLIGNQHHPNGHINGHININTKNGSVPGITPGPVQGQCNSQFVYNSEFGEVNMANYNHGSQIGNYNPTHSFVNIHSDPNNQPNASIYNSQRSPPTYDITNRNQTFVRQLYDMDNQQISLSSAVPTNTQMSCDQYQNGLPNYVQGKTSIKGNITSSQNNNNNMTQFCNTLQGMIQQMNSTFTARLDTIDQKVSKLDLIEMSLTLD